MKVLIHHIYEYQKGLRNLVLHTLPLECEEAATDKLRKYAIEYFIHNACGKRINVFFGAPECVAVIRTICDGKKLHHLTPEEDFVLGSMLGYGVRQQCDRYLKKSVTQDLRKVCISLCNTKSNDYLIDVKYLLNNRLMDSSLRSE